LSPFAPIKEIPHTPPPQTWEAFAATIHDDAAADEKPGLLQSVAASIVMKILWSARIARPDISRAVCSLARRISKWSTEDDRDLFYLVSYLNETADYYLVGQVGGPADELKVVAYADADFSGDKSCKSTSGAWVELSNADGSKTFPLGWSSKRQGSTARSTPEAELCAADALVHNSLLPLSLLWDIILQRTVSSTLMEDNSAALVVMKHGFSPSMRHLLRTHRICLAALHEAIVENGTDLEQCASNRMKADGFTKRFAATAWPAVLELLSMRAVSTPKVLNKK